MDFYFLQSVQVNFTIGDRYLIENKTMFSVEVKSILHDITKRSTLGFATENNQKRKNLMLEIKKDSSRISNRTITTTKF